MKAVRSQLLAVAVALGCLGGPAFAPSESASAAPGSHSHCRPLLLPRDPPLLLPRPQHRLLPQPPHPSPHRPCRGRGGGSALELEVRGRFPGALRGDDRTEADRSTPGHGSPASGGPALSRRRHQDLWHVAQRRRPVDDRLRGGPQLDRRHHRRFHRRLEVSLDRAFLELRHAGLHRHRRQFANPFATSELVWDGDVHPQGVTASLGAQGPGVVKPRVVGMFYVVDEQTASPDSFMLGGQAQVALPPSST